MFRCEHIYHVKRSIGMDVENITPKRPTLSTVFRRQREEGRGSGYKTPRRTDRASWAVQNTTNERHQSFLERIQQRIAAGSPSSFPPGRSTPSTTRASSPPAVPSPRSPPGLSPTRSEPEITSSPAPVRNSKRRIQLEFIEDDDNEEIGSITKKRRVHTTKHNCEVCDKCFATKHTLKRHLLTIHQK